MEKEGVRLRVRVRIFGITDWISRTKLNLNLSKIICCTLQLVLIRDTLRWLVLLKLDY